MYNKNKELKGTNNNVTTSMIWGCQWDQVMNWWLKDDTTKGYVTNSTNKGNYSGTQTGGSAPIPTGSNSEYSINNIYDMAETYMI